MNQKKIIECKDLCFAYNLSTKYVLKDITCSIYEKELICIVGTNGSGKSTFAKIIAGLLKPGRGTIERKLSVSYLEQKISFSSSVPLSVKDVVIMGRMTPKRLFFHKSDYHKVDEILHVCGISDLVEERIDELSGGQLQKVCIARMLCEDAHILLLDEISESLDPLSKDSLITLLKKIKKIKNIILISHDITMVSSLADRIFCLTDAHRSLDHAMFLEYISTHLGHIPINHLHAEPTSACENKEVLPA